MIFLLPGSQQIVQDCVPEIAAFIFRPNFIDITFYYPRRTTRHQSLLVAFLCYERFYYFCFYIYKECPVFPILFRTTSHHALILSFVLYPKTQGEVRQTFQKCLVLSQLRLHSFCYLWLVVVARTKCFSSLISETY